MRSVFIYQGLFLILLAGGIFLNANYGKHHTSEINKDDFVNILSRKKDLIDEYLLDFSKEIKERGLKSLSTDFYSDYAGLFQSEGLALYIYYNDRLQYWSTNHIPTETFDTARNHTVDKLGNGWYYIRRSETDSFSVLGVVLLKEEYSYENQYLSNTFQSDFNLPSGVHIIKDPGKGTVIRDENGEYLFSISPSSYERVASFMYYLSVVIFLAAFVFLFLIINKWLKESSPNRKWWIIPLVAVFLGLVRFLMLHFQYPDNLYQLEAFDPSFYASSSLKPNLGDLLLHLICLWYIMWLSVSHLRAVNLFKNLSKFYRMTLSGICILVNIVFFALIYYVFHSLIFNSSFSFDFHRFFDLEISGLLILLTIFILFFIYFLWIDFFLSKSSKLISYKSFVFQFILLSALAIGIACFFGVFPYWYTILFFYISHLIVGMIAYKNASYNYPRLIAMILVAVIFSMSFIHHNTTIKEKNKRKILVTSLESERDRVGELLLQRKEKQIASDSLLSQWMINHIENEMTILDYLRTRYFGGYFNKYDIQVSVCSPDDKLSVLYENSRREKHHCYAFFDQLLKDEGIPLGNSRFYFLDNMNERISYIGIIKYHVTDSYEESTLYLSLDSKLTSSQLGYPELLLARDLSEPGPLSDYSFAKYKYGELIRKSGGYDYPMKITPWFRISEEYSFKNHRDYSHLVYNTGEDSLIVISKPLNGFLDQLAQFSYIFAFFYLLTLLFIFISGMPENISRFHYNFKNKIKLSMVLILILSLIAVGTGTGYYTIEQFQKKQKESISEKMESLIVELEDKLSNKDKLNEEYSEYYNHLLTKFSNVFYVDMNLYDLEGNLLSSSRPQVFEKNLIGRRMDPVAYEKLSHELMPQFIHDEMIGNMKYHSAYVPFYNDRKQVLAYLNIPYFTRQKALQKEIYTIIMVMVNIYVFLIILGTVIAVIISNTITKPLRLIRQKLGRIGLDRPNEKIDYESHDEIGELVSEYNRMIDELETNAQRLAQSEREMAWREMAKQIAHEIKNPLTPMKLKVQYLKRAWDDQVVNFDERMKQFANSMIGQINALSDIASEFSNFAKMPKARNRKLDLSQQIDEAVNLFGDADNIKIEKELDLTETLYIHADKDQISRVFSNLIKNAIQAIPAQRKGLIRIGLTRKNDKAVVRIIDNGNGVPTEMIGKLFRPSFTTKSGGMGMGLAISNKIVEDLGGTITYETERGKGTTFSIEIPVYDEED